MTKNKKTITALLLIASLVVAGIVYWYLVIRVVPGKDVNLEPSTAEQKKAGEDLKDRFKDTGTETPPTTVKNPEQAEITRAYQDDAIGKIVVQTKLPGSGWASCVIKFASPTGVTIEKTAAAIYQPEYSTCEGFAIERNEFRQTGTWTILLDAKTINGGHSQATANVTIK